MDFKQAFHGLNCDMIMRDIKKVETQNRLVHLTEIPMK